MIPGPHDIDDIYIGDSWDRPVRVRNADGTYKSLTGLTILAQIRTTAGALVATMGVTVLDQNVAATLGAFVLWLTPAQTAALSTSARTGLWDVELSNTGRTYVQTPLAGAVSWTADVSRP